MKKIFKPLLLFMVVCMSLGIMLACGGGNDGKLKVTFARNDGTAETTVVDVEAGDTVDELTPTARENYEFTGWYTTSECTSDKKFDFEYAIESDMTLYAGWKVTAYTVSFNTNGGTAVASQNVAVGGNVRQPANPQKSNYLFQGWYTDAVCTKIFSFSTAINSELTLYAKWGEDTGDNVTITYSYNYDGAPSSGTYYEDTITNNSYPTTPGAPARENYYFAGWFTTADLTTQYTFTSRVTQNMTLYAKWLKKNIFEAEYVDLTGKRGVGYSSNVGGTDLIIKDRDGVAKASNQNFISYLYYEGANIEFVINSSAEVSDAVIYLRLSVEFDDLDITDEEFLVQVNGNALSYGGLYLTGAIMSEEEKREFEDVLISTTVDLVEGENRIKLIVNNNRRYDEIGTRAAMAPIIDCMYIYTTATLTWSPHTSNVK